MYFYPHGCADNLFCNKTIKVLLSLVEHSFLQHIKSLNYLYNLLYLNYKKTFKRASITKILLHKPEGILCYKQLQVCRITTSYTLIRTLHTYTVHIIDFWCETLSEEISLDCIIFGILFLLVIFLFLVQFPHQVYSAIPATCREGFL